MEQKLNILIVHNRYRRRGGEETVVDNEAKLLSEHGHNVYLYVRDNTELDKFNIFQKLLLPFASIYSLRTVREIKSIIKKNKIDVVHVHNTVALISPSVYGVAKSCGAKVVQTLHNFRFLCPNGIFFRDNHICEDCLHGHKFLAVKRGCYRNSKVQTLLLVISQTINRLLGNFKKIDKIISLTKFNAQKHSDFFDKTKIVVKPNFTVSSDIEILSASDRKGFIFVGRVEAYKGIFELIDFFIRHPQYELTVAGVGSDYQAVIDTVRKANVSNISFVGQVDADTVKKLLVRSRALIMPSKWYEGFPMTIAEALGMHTPVVGSNIGNVGSLAAESVGTFDVSDIDSLEVHLSQLSDDDFLQTQMDKAFRVYSQRYSAEVNYRLLLDIYTSV